MKRYKPKLNLFFDPPIKTVKEMELFLGTLNAVYPGLEWTSSGLFDEVLPVMNFNPLEDSSTVTGELPWTGEENEHDPIWFLTIGFFPDKPNKLTYTDGDEDSSLSNHEDYGYTWEDGRLWMNHRLPSSDELFDQLNENFQITDNMDLVGLNFTLGNASVIYKVLEKCYNPTFVTNEVEEIGWLVEWPNPLGYISPHGENLRACIGVNQMKRNFELGYYVPTNLPNVDDVFNQLSENTLPYDEPLKVGDKVSLSSESSYFGDGDENPSSEDLIGTIIEINHRNTLPIDVEWEERGWKYYNSYRESDLIFRGNRYNYDETSNLFNQLDESVEDDDLDWVKNIIDEMPWVTENSTNYDETSGLFDSLNEGYWEERYKSKRYTQKFEPGDRVIMNGNVGGKNFTNELGTVLKYKFTGGGAGHPHRVYLILFDTWNDKERNFLMSPVQADQNREFIDSRCREGSCWYTTSDNLEPAPDSSELFDSLNESDDNWFDDVLEPYSSMEVEEGEWEVIRQGHMYPGNITLLYYFNISNIRDRIDAVALENGIDKSEYDLSTEDGIEEYTNRIERATGYRVYDMVVSQDVIGDRYVGDRLYDGDICLKFKGEWSHETHWAKEPVYHMMRLRDNAHFVIGKSGVRRKEFSNLNEAVKKVVPKVGDVLVCHTPVVMEYNGKVEALKDKVYTIKDVLHPTHPAGWVLIKNESGQSHAFNIGGKDGFKNWFTLIPKENYDSVVDVNFWDI